MKRLGALETPRDDSLYYVVPSKVNVRTGPGTGFAIAGQLLRGTKVYIDSFKEGEKLSGSSLWAHLSIHNDVRDLGFIHSRLITQ